MCGHDGDFWICDNCINHFCARCGPKPIRAAHGFVCGRCKRQLETCGLCGRPALKWRMRDEAGRRVCEPCADSPAFEEARLTRSAADLVGCAVRHLEKMEAGAPKRMQSTISHALSTARAAAEDLKRLREIRDEEAEAIGRTIDDVKRGPGEGVEAN